METKEILELIKKGILDKKGKDMAFLNVNNLTSLAEYFVVCTAQNRIQAHAISDNIEDEMTEKGMELLRKEGYGSGSWVVLDYGVVIIHVFQNEDKEYYKLEKLWSDAEITRFDDEGNEINE